MDKEICPRCGREISWIEKRVIGSRTYLYAVHRVGRSIKKCYLGPEDTYIYVSKTHSNDGLIFWGLIRSDRLKLYLSSILQALSSSDFSEEDLRDILFALRDAERVIEEKLRKKREERRSRALTK